MARMIQPTRLVTHPATVAGCTPAIERFLAEEWPEARPSDREGNVWFAAYTKPPVTVALHLTCIDSGAPGFFPMHARIRFTTTLDTAVTSPTEPRALDRANALIDSLAARLQRDVPIDYARAVAKWNPPRASLTALSSIVSDHLGDPDVFAALVQTGWWRGVVQAPGDPPVQLRVRFPNYGIGRRTIQPLDVEAYIESADAARIGVAAAAVVVDRVVTQIIEGIAHRVDTARPRQVTRELFAKPQALPPLFYGTTQAVITYASRLGGHQTGRGDHARTVIMVPEHGTRAELGLAVIESANGTLAARATLNIETVAHEGTAEDVRRWQEMADSAAADLVRSVERNEVAPAFSIAASLDDVAREVRTALRSAIPSTIAVPIADGYRVTQIPLGDDVLGAVDVRLVAVSEWETRVTVTGRLAGAGVSRDPHRLARERGAYRDSVARVAAQMREEIQAAIGITLPERGDIGLA